MISACIVLPYVSYCIPIILLLIKGRDKIPRGPFWLGKIPGLASNIVALCFTLFAIVMYSFPTVMPVQPDSKYIHISIKILFFGAIELN
jgi:choline transport protein